MDDDSRAFHFGRWLKRQIEDTGRSQSTFAASAGISRAAIQLWLTSPAPRIQGHNLARLAKALGIKREGLEARLNLAHNPPPPASGQASSDDTATVRLVPSPAKRFLDGNRDARWGFITATVPQPHGELQAVVLHGKIHQARNLDTGETVSAASALVVVFESMDAQKSTIIEDAIYVVWAKGEGDNVKAFRLRSNPHDAGSLSAKREYTSPARSQTKSHQIARSDIEKLGLVRVVIDYALLPAPPGETGSEAPRRKKT